MATGFYFDYDPDEFYVWRPPSHLLSIHLSLAVVNRLEQECLRAARDAQPRELAGVLLGYSLTTPEPASYIEDFALLPEQDEASPPAGLRSDSLARRLGALTRRVKLQQKPMGFFRWQRGGWLSLADRDLEAANRLFSGPHDIVMLIRHSDSRGNEAAFFWREGGLIPFRDSCSEFPFNAGKLSQNRFALPRRRAVLKHKLPFGRSTNREVEPRHPGMQDAAPPRRQELDAPPRNLVEDTSIDFEPYSAEVPQAHNRRPWLWIPLIPTAVIAMILTGAGAAMVGSSHRSSSETVTQAVADDSSLGLRVTQKSHQLVIQWNPNAAAILKAQSGTVRIVDGTATQVAEFNGQELREGYVAFEPSSREVTVRVEVKAQDGAMTTESVTFLGAVSNK